MSKIPPNAHAALLNASLLLDSQIYARGIKPTLETAKTLVFYMERLIRRGLTDGRLVVKAACEMAILFLLDLQKGVSAAEANKRADALAEKFLRSADDDDDGGERSSSNVRPDAGQRSQPSQSSHAGSMAAAGSAKTGAESAAQQQDGASNEDGDDSEGKALQWIKAHRKQTVIVATASVAFLLLVILRSGLTVSAACLVKPGQHVAVRAGSTGRVISVKKALGAKLEPNEVVLKIDDRALILQLKKLDLNIEQIQTSIDQTMKGQKEETLAIIKEKVRRLQSEYSFAMKAFQRNKKLFESKVISESALEKAREAQVLAYHRLSEAKTELEAALEGPTKEELTIQYAELEKLQNEQTLLKSTLADTEVSTPIAGTLSTPKMEALQDQVVQEGQMLFEVISVDKVEIEISVPEKEVGVIRVGQRVDVKVRSQPTETFTGVLEQVAPTAEKTELGEHVVKALSTIANPEGKLVTGATCSAKIEGPTKSLLGIMIYHALRWFRI